MFNVDFYLTQIIGLLDGLTEDQQASVMSSAGTAMAGILKSTSTETDEKLALDIFVPGARVFIDALEDGLSDADFAEESDEEDE